MQLKERSQRGAGLPARAPIDYAKRTSTRRIALGTVGARAQADGTLLYEGGAQARYGLVSCVSAAAWVPPVIRLM